MNLEKGIRNKILISFIILVIAISAFAVGLELYSAPMAEVHGNVKKGKNSEQNHGDISGRP